MEMHAARRWALLAGLGLWATNAAAAGPDGDAQAVSALLDAWLAAEESGDLPGYTSMLAPAFASGNGPDGQGPATRAAWLASAKDRLQTRTRVVLVEREVVQGTGVAVARLRLKKGADGEARVAWLGLAAGDAGWRVQAAEEGPVRKGSREAPSGAGEPAAWPVVLAGHFHVVLTRARREHFPSPAEPPLAGAEDGWLVWPVGDPGSDPIGTHWKGRGVVLHDRSGPVCRGVVGDAVLLVRERGSSSDASPPAEALALARTWGDAPGGAPAVVAVRVGTVDESACRGAAWAHRDDDAPERLAPVAVSHDLRKRGLSALRRLPMYRAAGRLLAAAAPDSRGEGRPRRRVGAWDEKPTVRVTVRAFEDAPGGALYLAVATASTTEPCVGAWGLWQVFGGSDDGLHLVLLSDPEGPARPFVPDVAFGWAGSRVPIFADPGRLLRLDGARVRTWLDLSRPSYVSMSNGGSTTPVASATLRPSKARAAPIEALERARHEPSQRSP
jgi:hypothetical protein